MLASLSLPGVAQTDKELAPEESTAAVSVIKADKTDRRSAKTSATVYLERATVSSRCRTVVAMPLRILLSMFADCKRRAITRHSFW